MPDTPRARRPFVALGALAFLATTGLLSACTSPGSGSAASQPSPATAQSPVPGSQPGSQPSPSTVQTPVSPAPSAAQPRASHGAEHLDPARFSRVKVTYHLSDGETRINLDSTFRSPAVIARLTRIINGFPAAKPAGASCPPGTETYRLLFTGSGSEPDAMVTTNCPDDRITADGHPGHLLLDRSGALAAAVKDLMSGDSTGT